MTNQEPGAPEPLTSLREALMLFDKMEVFQSVDDAAAGEVRVKHSDLAALRAALSHPESDTREDADLEAWRQFTMDLADGKVSEKPNGLVREAFAYAWNAAHPESGTRGLDVERLGAWFCGTFDHTDHEALLQWGDVCDEGRADARSAAKYAASPDLSIDREGLTVEALTDAVRTALRSTEYDLYEPITSPHGLDHDPPILAAAILATLRGTTQPEPTE